MSNVVKQSHVFKVCQLKAAWDGDIPELFIRIGDRDEWTPITAKWFKKAWYGIVRGVPEIMEKTPVNKQIGRCQLCGKQLKDGRLINHRSGQFIAPAIVEGQDVMLVACSRKCRTKAELHYAKVKESFDRELSNLKAANQILKAFKKSMPKEATT